MTIGATTDGTRSTTIRRLAFVALAWLAVGVTWVGGIGRYGGPDEPAHVLRAYAVAHGDVLGVRTAGLPSGYRAVTVPRSLGTGDPTCYRHDPTLPSTCSTPAPADASGDTAFVATSAGVAPPLYYALIGLPVRLAGAAADPLAYRLAALAWVVVALTLAVARARPLGSGALVMLIAVPPSAWFMLGVTNPNSLEMALVALAWVGVARARRRGPIGTMTTADVWWMAVPLGLAVAMRPIAAVATAAVVAVLVVDSRTRPSARATALLCAPAVIGGASVVAWQRIIHWDGTDPRTATEVPLWRSLRDSMGGLGRTAGELVGTTGWLELSLPVLVKVAWLVLLAAVVARTRITRWRVWAVWAGVLIGTPVMFEAVFASSIGPIWQGRYSLPVFIGAGALAVRPAGAQPTHLRRALAACVIVEIVAFWATVRRYAVGIDGSWWLSDAARSSRWLAPRAWLVVHLAMMVAILVWLRRAGGIADVDVDIADADADADLQHVAEHVDDDVGVARVVEHGQFPG